jgi:hypothetical protein
LVKIKKIFREFGLRSFLKVVNKIAKVYFLAKILLKFGKLLEKL